MGKNPKEDPKDHGHPQPSSWLRRRLGRHQEQDPLAGPEALFLCPAPVSSASWQAAVQAPPSTRTLCWSLSGPSSPLRCLLLRQPMPALSRVGVGPRAPASRGQSPEPAMEQTPEEEGAWHVVLWSPRCPTVYNGYMLFQGQPGHFVFNSQKLLI